MGRYLGKRLISTIPLLLVISFVVFMFIHMIPGDPARLVAGQDATKEDVAVVREQLGLDEPLLVQYGKYMKGLFTGDLGSSIKNGKTVVETIAPRLKPTIMPGMASNQWTGNLEELYSSITYNGSRNHGRTCQIFQIFHA